MIKSRHRTTQVCFKHSNFRYSTSVTKRIQNASIINFLKDEKLVPDVMTSDIFILLYYFQRKKSIRVKCWPP